jgi:hypothetical protein
MADIWPTAPVLVTDQVKQQITRFFEISDSPDPKSGKLFADELFTKDATFKTHKTCVFRGHDGMYTLFYMWMGRKYNGAQALRFANGTVSSNIVIRDRRFS